MKKLVCVVMVLGFVLGLSACNGDGVVIEDYEWKMRTVMSNNIDAAQNEENLIVAVGEAD